MGAYLAAAADRLALDYHTIDARDAHAKSRIGRSFYWRFRGKRPARLSFFSAKVLELCIGEQCDVVLTTGCAPLDRHHIERLRAIGIKVINYSTDDPWNPAHRAEWFLSTLSAYDAVFTPRRGNMDDFRRSGARVVQYVPFAFDPDIHRPWPEGSVANGRSDVLFVGGCDADRLPIIRALIGEGLAVAVFGGYWDRYSDTRPVWRGNTDQDAIRSASAAARISLCLVRRANRDGNTMRTFEAAAIGGCLLVEDTPDHRELFGPNDDAVRYFSSVTEMVLQARSLIRDSDARDRLAFQLFKTFDRSKHTYASRLRTMLEALDVKLPSVEQRHSQSQTESF